MDHSSFQNIYNVYFHLISFIIKIPEIVESRECPSVRMAVSAHFLVFDPGKSFRLKFIPNQSDLFRNLFPRQSELIRVNPKKVFNLV